MRVERAQVEEINITYCDTDLLDMLRYEDTDGVIKPLPEGSTVYIEGNEIRVRFFQERTIINDSPATGEPVEDVEEQQQADIELMHTVKSLYEALPTDRVGARAMVIYQMLVDSKEPLTTRDVHAALRNGMTISPTRRSILALKDAGAIECVGTQYPKVRSEKAVRKMLAWRPARKKSTTSKE